jgi:hypothetical protein
LGADTVDIIKEIAPYTGVLIVIWYVFRYSILRPLNTSIELLSEAIKELRKEIKENEERRHDMEIKITEIDARAKSAQHRLDNLERS